MRALVVLTTLVTLACGGAAPTPGPDAGSMPMPPPADAGQPPPMDAGLPPPVDAGTPPPVDAGVPSLTGLVEVEVSAGLEMLIPVTTSITASFGRPIDLLPSCRTRTVASCTVTDCLGTGDGGMQEPDRLDGGTEPPLAQVPTAGRLTVEEGATRLTLEPDAMSGGYQLSEEGERLTPGRSLTVTAAGAQVPAFTATLALPERITVTAPSCSFTGCGTLDRARDLRVEWTGAQGPVTLGVTGGRDDALRIIECRAASSPGVIPAAALAGMPAEFTLFQVSRRAEATVQAGAVPVTLRATTQSLLGTFLQVR